MVQQRYSAIVPVKRLSQAKSRLGLPESTRIPLVEGLLLRTTECLLQSPWVSSCSFLSPEDVRVPLRQQHPKLGWLSELGWIDETKLYSSQQSLELNQSLAALPCVESQCILFPDLPKLTTDEVNQLLEFHHQSGLDAVLVPDYRGGGTNGVVLRAGIDFGFRFGENSLREHFASAWSRGLQAQAFRLPALMQDLDYWPTSEQERQDILERFKGNGSARNERLLG